jgi:hypothetical protein
VGRKRKEGLNIDKRFGACGFRWQGRKIDLLFT